MIVTYLQLGAELTGHLKEFHARQKAGLETILVNMSDFVYKHQHKEPNYADPKVKEMAWKAFTKLRGDIHYLKPIEMEFAKMIFFIVLDKYMNSLKEQNS